ncbi:MAG: DUF1080 domain-containing protein [Planctomycetota bacterium]|nr:MAG: DUF1080 domain-containing protein [Planctomycetota bacterium]
MGRSRRFPHHFKLTGGKVNYAKARRRTFEYLAAPGYEKPDAFGSPAPAGTVSGLTLARIATEIARIPTGGLHRSRTAIRLMFFPPRYCRHFRKHDLMMHKCVVTIGRPMHAGSPLLVGWFILLSGVCLPARTSVAQHAVEGGEPPLERVAWTEPPQGDADFTLMGEFVGPVAIRENKYQSVGLQIRPIGRGNFEAIQYTGGLPGQAGFQRKAKPSQLVGRRHGKFLVLAGGPWAILVHPDHCLVVSETGERIGRLERVWRSSPTMGAPPPKTAIVLFDGSGTEQFTVARMTEQGLLMAGADVKPMFQDFNMHVEFRVPYMPHSQGQARGNSGCYLQSRYEVQILDSFALIPQFNDCSSLYRFKAPDLNMCFPPLRWQTYDIVFTAPRWAADGTKIHNARITVWHNGVKTQDDVELPNKTGAGKPEEPTLLPIRFQDHRDPVVFRNIWIIDRGLSVGKFPVYPPREEPPSPEPPAEQQDRN